MNLLNELRKRDKNARLAKHFITFRNELKSIIKLVAKKGIKCSASLVFHLFSPTRLMNSIKHEHSCKGFYIILMLLILLFNPLHAGQFFMLLLSSADLSGVSNSLDPDQGQHSVGPIYMIKTDIVNVKEVI